MEKLNKGLLTVSVLILLLGTFLLLSGELALRRNHILSPIARYHMERGIPIKTPGTDSAFREDLKANRDSAYPYFLLGAGLLVLTLLLPRLAEFSFSPTSGLSVKVLHEAKEAIREATATAQAIALKSRPPAGEPQAREGFLRPEPDLQDEVKKLEENLIRLNTYTDLLDKMSNTKNKG
ncbi:hypothetical protein [Pontibacter chitinilyticus]|uniref:hypothetical protein n=1 Tax=Pontibacter chitinilyticus TaxID=2674989 RepID=UPI00321AAAD3